MSSHNRTTPEKETTHSQDPHRATSRNAAQGFSPSQDPRDAVSQTVSPASDASQAHVNKGVASAAKTPTDLDPDRSPGSATLRNAAQCFSDDKRCAAEDHASAATDATSSDDHEWSLYLANLFKQFPAVPVPKSADTEHQAWHKPLELTEQQRTAITLMLRGERKNKIASKVGVHPGTIWRWTSSDENFRRGLTIARERAFRRATEEIREAVPQALDVVKHHLDKRSLQAALQILRLVHIERQSPSSPVETMFPKFP